MADEHFSRDTIVRFFRFQLSGEESRSFVRHLLRQCPCCAGLLREVGERRDFRLLLRALEIVALQSDDGRTQDGIASSERRMPWTRISMG
jgi:hypothetical protein